MVLNIKLNAMMEIQKMVMDAAANAQLKPQTDGHAKVDLQGKRVNATNIFLTNQF